MATTVFKALLHYHRCLALLKAMNGEVDFKFGLKKNIEIHDHFTRRRHDLRLPKVPTNYVKQMFKY